MTSDSTTDHRKETWDPDRRFWQGRRVGVTGGTGFVGSHLVAALVDLGADVVVLRRDLPVPSPVIEAWTRRVSFVDGSIEDTYLVERLLAEYEVQTLFHLAAQSQVGVANRNPLSTFEANVRGTWSVLEAARRSPAIAGVVVASSDKAYGDQPRLPYTEEMPLSAVHPYDVSKACADMVATSYAKSFGVPVAITRCGNFFGPGDVNWERLIPGTARSLVRGERPVIRSDGTLTRDYLYVVDGVRAYLQLAERIPTDGGLHGCAFNFSNESPLSVLELVSMFQQAMGTELEPDIKAVASGEISHQSLSAERARTKLGWKPAYSTLEALQETGAWYRAYLEGGGGARL